MKTNLIIPVLATTLSLAAMADVPNLIHHQGVLQDDEGNPVNAPADFKFAFVNGDATVSFWSNDGTSFAGSEPAASVALPVSDGLFNVQLGNTDIGMVALPPSVFTTDEVFLRIWVNGEQLTPDRQVTSVGYAMQAATVADGAITPGAIPANTITSSHIVDGSVGSDDIADAITLETLKLEKGGSQLSEFTVANNSPILNFWDGLGTPTTSMGDLLGGGRLKLFQISGKPGITADGDAATYANGSSAGGEFIVHDSAGEKGVFLDGENAGGARIEVHQKGGSSPFIEAEALGDFGGAEVVVRGAEGVNGVEIFGQGSEGGADPKNPDGNRNGAGTIKLYQPEGLGAVLYGSSTQGGGAISLRDQWGDTKFRMYGGKHSASLDMGNAQGLLTIEADAAYGTFGESRLVLRQALLGGGSVNTVQIEGGTNDFGDSGGQIRLRDEQGHTTIDLDAASTNGGSHVKLRNHAGQTTIEFDAQDGDGNGIIRTQVLEITGGSDLTEQFNINPNALEPEPGMLVSIDPTNPGELVVSTKAYDRTAAGVISGAGGVKPGMLMGQKGSIADGDHPVALTGRVYCYVDTEFGQIEPGDLITTSPTPGHGMKVTDHSQAQGAIVGKAMTELKEGRGLVLVLVSLQ
ncbi:hypothetical protein [Haloferula helveola]